MKENKRQRIRKYCKNIISFLLILTMLSNTGLPTVLAAPAEAIGRETKVGDISIVPDTIDAGSKILHVIEQTFLQAPTPSLPTAAPQRQQTPLPTLP